MKWMKYILLLVVLGCATSQLDKDNEEFKKSYQRPESIPYPENNKWTQAREDLGKMLFFEPRLSGSGVTSCASCHNPSLGWEDGLPKAMGHGHKILGRKTPTVLNLAWAPRLFWDGRSSSLEEQALGPERMSSKAEAVLNRAIGNISKIQGYEKPFEMAYPGEGINKETIAKALATFERTLVSGESNFDKWVNGEDDAISNSAKKGFHLFNGKAKCASCHTGWAFTDYNFHDIGIEDRDLGRGKYLKTPMMKNAFKTPTLRDIAERGPYFHGGQAKTLVDVVEFYNRGGDAYRKSKSPRVAPLELSSSEIEDLVAFLMTLSEQKKDFAIPALPSNR